MKSALLVISAIVIVLLLPSTMWAINEFRSKDHAEPHIVDTGVGETDADVVLSQELFGNQTSNVTIVSDNALDAPIPATYTENTRTLNVTGLNADDTRTLDITYKIDALVDYVGAGIAARVWPVFIILGIIGLVAAGIYSATRRGE